MILAGRKFGNVYLISFFPNGIEIEYSTRKIIDAFKEWETMAHAPTFPYEFIKEMQRKDVVYWEMPEINIV